MNSLNGEGAFDVGAGELIGLDIVGMIRNLDTSFVGDTRRTIFDEITVSFRVVDGVVIYDNLAVNAPLFRATGTGEIGLGAQTLNLRLMPELLGGEEAGLAVPLTIRGTWDAPRIGLDLENLVRRGIETELGRVMAFLGTPASAAERAMDLLAQVGLARPQPVSRLLTPARRYITVSKSGEMCSP